MNVCPDEPFVTKLSLVVEHHHTRSVLTSEILGYCVESRLEETFEAEGIFVQVVSSEPFAAILGIVTHHRIPGCQSKFIIFKSRSRSWLINI